MGKKKASTATIDAAYLKRQRKWSKKTFGPSMRTEGIIDHMTKEFDEIRAEPNDVGEWVDLVILGLDGAWRCGGKPQEIIDAIHAKMAKNEAREWPDWRNFDEGTAIEHDRSKDVLTIPDGMPEGSFFDEIKGWCLPDGAPVMDITRA